MEALFTFWGFIRGRMKVSLVLTMLVMLFCCRQDDECTETSSNKVLNDIESNMLQYPEHLDSLVSKIDTINITQCDSARIYMIKGYLNYLNGAYDRSISELAKADAIFQALNDEYYLNLNNLIKAFVFELLDLDNNATELYIGCNEYFKKNHIERYKFYSTLGILRFSKKLNINRQSLIIETKKSIEALNQPIYEGLFYSAMGNLEKNDSNKIRYYTIAKEQFSIIQNWNKVYTQELNILFAKIRLNSSEETLKYYQQLIEKYNFYNPTTHQRMKFKYALAYLFTKQDKNKEAISVANALLKDPDLIKFPDIESYCVNLLSVSYWRLVDYKNAYDFLLKDNALLEKIRESKQDTRLQALGAYYKHSELEKEKINLKLRIQRFLLYATIIILILIAVISMIWIKLKDSRHKQEILKLKNIEIEDQIQNLLRALESQNNTRLVHQVERIGEQYKDSQLISRLILDVDHCVIDTWSEFETKFLELRFNWMHNLKQEINFLSQTDMKYCMCLYLELNNSTMSRLCCVSIDAIKSGKKRIRDKLNLNDASEISGFLKKFE